jgi:hypothetical protein
MLSSDGTSLLKNKSSWSICFGDDKEKSTRIGAKAAGRNKALKISVNQAFRS